MIHSILVLPVVMRTEPFWIDKIQDKPNFASIFGKLQEQHLKYHYSTPALLYGYVIAVLYCRHFKIQCITVFVPLQNCSTVMLKHNYCSWLL